MRNLSYFLLSRIKAIYKQKSAALEVKHMLMKGSKRSERPRETAGNGGMSTGARRQTGLGNKSKFVQAERTSTVHRRWQLQEDGDVLTHLLLAGAQQECLGNRLNSHGDR